MALPAALDKHIMADEIDIDALKRALTDSFRQSMHAALIDVASAANAAAKSALEQAAAAKKESAPKPVPAPAKPQPTGIKPRLVLLPALVMTLMVVPVVGIFLPVFLNAAKQRQVEMDTKTFRCALYQPTDTQYMALGNEYYPPMTRANQSVIDAYLGGLGEQCPVVGAYLFGTLSTEEELSSPVLDKYFSALANWPGGAVSSTGGTSPANPDEPYLAGAIRISLSLTTLDVLANLASFTLSIKPDLGGDFYDARTNALVLKNGWSLQVDVNSEAGSTGQVTFRTDDRQVSRTTQMGLDVLTTLYRYPFDQYETTVSFTSLLTNVAAGADLPLALLVRQSNSLTGWLMTVHPVARGIDAVVDSIYLQKSEVTYIIRLQRSPYVKFFAVAVLLCMWACVSYACVHVIDAVLLRSRALTVPHCSMLFAIVFAVDRIRGIIPGIPPYGVGVDYFGSLCLSHLTASYTHASATAWDKAISALACCRGGSKASISSSSSSPSSPLLMEVAPHATVSGVSNNAGVLVREPVTITVKPSSPGSSKAGSK